MRQPKQQREQQREQPLRQQLALPLLLLALLTTGCGFQLRGEALTTLAPEWRTLQLAGVTEGSEAAFLLTQALAARSLSVSPANSPDLAKLTISDYQLQLRRLGSSSRDHFTLQLTLRTTLHNPQGELVWAQRLYRFETSFSAATAQSADLEERQLHASIQLHQEVALLLQRQLAALS
ncbi:MAG: hypothetical protein HQL49_03260 [Gammaproteobacteria bacterium]|nr:hypothetical protein [Gammaproteobacteria bacterium]